MTDDDFGCMVTSMTNLFADKNCRDSVTVSMYVGNEEANTPFLKAEVRTAHGHDGMSQQSCTPCKFAASPPWSASACKVSLTATPTSRTSAPMAHVTRR